MELALLSAFSKSRETHELASKYLVTKAYSREYQIVWEAIDNYYKRDREAKSASVEVVAAVLEGTIKNPKHRDRFNEYLASVVAADASPINVKEFVLQAKKEELANRIAVSMANKDGKEAPLLEEYMQLQKATTLDDPLTPDVVVIDSSSIKELMGSYLANEGAFQLYPKALNDRLKGRLSKGHHVTVFSPPEGGKSAFNVTAAAGFCMQGRKGIYFLNEDKNEDMFFRLCSCLSGMSYDDALKDPDRVISAAVDRGVDNLKLIGLAPGSVSIISSLVEKYDPEWIVVDQMINLNEKGDGLSQILGKAARGLRTLGKQADILVISTCQAGDSAAGKAVLAMGDVYQSNTEVPAQADILLGVGANADQYTRNERTFTMIKNKVTGTHTPFTVRLDPSLSRYTSIG